MKGRIYVCPVIGTGTADDPQRALVEDLAGVKYTSACIDTFRSGARAGEKRHPWSIVHVDADDWAAVEAHPDCHRLPDATSETPDLDGPIPAGLRAKLRGLKVRSADNAHPRVRLLIEGMLAEHYPDAKAADVFPGLID